MTNVIKMSKKAFTWSVVLTTILWSMGVAALIPAGFASSATIISADDVEAGDLVQKLNDTTRAVYYITEDMERMYFPNAEVFNTWYPNFNDVKVVDADFDEMWPPAFPNAVAPRPGSDLLFKTTASARVYAMGMDNQRYHIANEAAAKTLFGDNWASKVRDWSDTLTSQWTLAGEQIDSPYDGYVAEEGGKNYQMKDGMWYEVTGDLPSFVGSMEVSNFSDYEVASDTVTAASLTADPSQGVQGGTKPPVDAGELHISLAASTPGGSTIADGTAYNDMLILNVKAGDTDAKLKGLTVTRTGLIANANVTGVSIWDEEGNRHGEVMSSFNTDDEIVIGFGSDPILIPANDSVEVSVRFNLGTSASGGTVGATVKNANAIDTDADVSGNFPLVGNAMSVVDGSSSLATVLVTSQAVSGASASTGSANMEIGETKTIGKVKITEESGRNDIQLEKINFYLEGTLDDNDFQDFELYSPTNELLGSTEWASDHYVTIALDEPYVIEKSKNRTLSLKATAVDGSAHYVRVHVQNDYDVLVRDAALKYYIIPYDVDSSTTWTDEVDSSTGWFILKSGSLALSKANDSPSLDITVGSDDAVLAKFNVKAVGEDMEVRKVGIKITTTQGSYPLRGNVKLVADGVTVLTFSGAYSTALYSTGSQRTLSNYFTVKSGKTVTLEVVGSINSSAAEDDDYQVYIGNFYTKRLTTKDFADNLPSSSYTTAGNNVLVSATSLTFVKDTSYGNTTVSQSASNALLGQFKLKAGTAEGICLTNLAVTLAGYPTVSAPDDYQNLEVWFGNQQFGSTVTTVSTSSNSFSSNKCLDISEETTLYVKADIGSSAGAGPVSTTIDANYSYVGRYTNEVDSTNDAVIGQDITIGGANVVLSAVNDSTTLSSIHLPTSEAVQVGKWKMEAQNSSVILNKITFQVRDETYADDTAAGNFGTMYLYDSANMSTALASASYIPGTSNGYVRFEGVNLTITAGSAKYLVVKTTVNGGTTLNAASKNVLVVRSDSSTDIQINDTSGGVLGTSAIDATNGDNTTNSRFATSTYYLYHNAAPTIANNTLGSALGVKSADPIFRFTVTNNGDREMRIGTTTITVSATGLTGDSASTTGTISNWRLYEANSSGGLGVLLATTNTCALVGGTGTATACNVNSAAGNSITVEFGEQQSASDNWEAEYILVQPNSSRTLILVADTSGVFNGKTQGSVSVTGVLDGATGWSTTAGSDGDTYWNNGVIEYYYKQSSAGSYNSTAYTGSDSYDVTGDTLKASL